MIRTIFIFCKSFSEPLCPVGEEATPIIGWIMARLTKEHVNTLTEELITTITTYRSGGS